MSCHSKYYRKSLTTNPVTSKKKLKLYFKIVNNQPKKAPKHLQVLQST